MAGGISANLPRNFLALWGARAVGPITNPLWTVPTRLNVNYQAQGMYSGVRANLRGPKPVHPGA